MPEQARVIGAVMRMEGVRRAVVAGHSMGAAVAIALAESDPSLVSGLVVVDEPARPGQGILPLTAKLGFYPLIGPAVRRLATDSVLYDAFKSGFAPGFRYPRWVVQDNRRMTYSSYESSARISNGSGRADPPHRRRRAQPDVRGAGGDRPGDPRLRPAPRGLGRHGRGYFSAAGQISLKSQVEQAA